MENATKGLMIAGAILIAIVLIGIGVFLVSQAQGFMDQGGTQFDEMTKSAFNSPFESYSGRKNGSDIRALINKVNSSNLTAASEDTHTEKGIKVMFDAEITKAGAVTIDGTVEDYVSANATKSRNAINTGHTYYVSLGYSNETGLINIIGIGTTQETADDFVESGAPR